jgi:hypothetical protein
MRLYLAVAIALVAMSLSATARTVLVQCPYLLLGPSQPALLIDGRGRPIEATVMQACLKEGWGYTMAYDAAVRSESTRDTLAFLEKTLRR